MLVITKRNKLNVNKEMNKFYIFGISCSSKNEGVRVIVIKMD